MTYTPNSLRSYADAWEAEREHDDLTMRLLEAERNAKEFLQVANDRLQKRLAIYEGNEPDFLTSMGNYRRSMALHPRKRVVQT